MQSQRRSALVSVVALTVATTVALSACGFQLRGSRGEANIPFATLHLGFPEASSLGNELRRNIRASNGTALTADPKTADASVELLSETREKITLSLNKEGRIREYSLLYKVRFRVKNKQDKELLAPTEVVLKRDISFNEEQAIAKEREEELLYRDMQTDLVQQILRRLAALKPQ